VLAESRCGHSDDPVDSILAELDLQKKFGTLSEDQQKTLRLHFIEVIRWMRLRRCWVRPRETSGTIHSED
jgi:hypothetical protein